MDVMFTMIAKIVFRRFGGCQIKNIFALSAHVLKTCLLLREYVLNLWLITFTILPAVRGILAFTHSRGTSRFSTVA